MILAYLDGAAALIYELYSTQSFFFNTYFWLKLVAIFAIGCQLRRLDFYFEELIPIGGVVG